LHPLECARTRSRRWLRRTSRQNYDTEAPFEVKSLEECEWELELQATSLKGATMPNGQKYEDWLKDKKAREEGR
jgi:hypothetical protein